MDKILGLLHRGRALSSQAKRFILKWYHGFSRLHQAVLSDCPDKTRILLQDGEDPNVRDRRQRTPLHISCYNESPACLDFLLSNGADVNRRDETGSTPLHTAIVHGRLSHARNLLQKGANPNLKDGSGRTALHVALLQQRMEFAELCLEYGADVTCHENVLNLVRKGDDTENKLGREGCMYDIFVLCSPDDERWVNQCLANKLRDMKVGLRIITLPSCGLPGKPVEEWYAELSQLSRTFVLVLSPSYIESNLCMSAFYLVYNEAESTGKPLRIIIHEKCQLPGVLLPFDHFDWTGIKLGELAAPQDWNKLLAPLQDFSDDCNGQEWSFGNNCALNTSSKLVAKSGEANFDEIPAHGRSEKDSTLYKYDAFVTYSTHDREWVDTIPLPKLESHPSNLKYCIDFKDSACIADSTLYKYDVFVMYSQHDREWVNTILLPKLESHPSDLKYCIDFKDFLPGEFVLENIYYHAKHSRCLILVISPHYKSSYYEHLSLWLQETSGHVLIPICLRGCPLPKRLKKRRYSALKWTDDSGVLFWQDLFAILCLRKQVEVYDDVDEEATNHAQEIFGDIDKNISPQQQLGCAASQENSYAKPIAEDYCTVQPVRVKLLRLSNEQECYDDIYECVEVSVNTEQGCYQDMSGEVEELYDNVVGDIDRNISPQQQEAITGESYVKPIKEDYCAPPAIGILNVSEKLIGVNGGQLHLNNVHISIKAGSLQEPTLIRVSKIEPEDFIDAVVRAGLTNDVILADSVLKLEPHGQVFNSKVAVEMSLQKEKPQTHSLEVFHGTFNPKGLVQWEHVSKDRCSFKKGDRTVTIRLSHFSLISCVYWCKVALLQPSKAASYYFSVWPFAFHIGIYLKRDFPNRFFSTLRVVLISSTIYQEKRLRNECSSVQKCKLDGFQEICFQQCMPVWNSEDVEISLALDGDLRLKNGESRKLKVESTKWWSDGEIIDYELRQKEEIALFKGRFEIKPDGRKGVPVCFQEELCPLVKKCLGIQNGYVCNLKPVAEKLGLDEEESKDILLKNQSDQSCLEQMLSKWKKGQHHDRLGQLTSLMKEIPKEACEVSDRGCMHIEHLRVLEKEVPNIKRQTDPRITTRIQERALHLFDEVLRDCCVETLDSEEELEKCLESKEYLANLSAFKEKLVDPSLVKLTNELQQKLTTPGLLAIFPMLIQLVKEVFCKQPSSVELTGVWGLPKEDADQFDCHIKDAAKNVRRGPLIALLSNVLAKVNKLPHNKGETSDTQIEKWRKRLDFEKLSEILAHPIHLKLRRRIMMISETLNAEVSPESSKDNEIVVSSCRNVAFQLVDQLKFRPQSVVQFSFLDDQLGIKPKGDVKFSVETKVFSQEFHKDRNDCEQVSLHASASVCERGCVRKLGRLTIGFTVTEHEAEKIEVWRQSSLSKRRTLLTQLASSDSFTVSLYGTDEKELQGYLDELAGVIERDVCSKDVSETKSVVLTLRSIDVKDGLLEGEAAQSLSTELLYKYPGPSIDFRSRVFEEVCDARAQELVDENLSIAKDVLFQMKTEPVMAATPFHYQALANRPSGVPAKLLGESGAKVLVVNQVQYNTVAQGSGYTAIGPNPKIIQDCDREKDKNHYKAVLE